jgi:anti-sigma factor RsiW
MTEMACNELVDVITAYLDGTLPEHDRCRFDAHVAGCPSCKEYVAQMRQTITRLGTFDEATLSQQTRQGIIAAFRDWRR